MYEGYAPHSDSTHVVGCFIRYVSPTYFKVFRLQPLSSLFNIDSDKLLRVMDVNWLGTVMACQVFAVNMVGRDGCSIINITSMAAYDALSMVGCVYETGCRIPAASARCVQ